MIIKDIQHVQNGATRTDGRYPQRIGSNVEFYIQPECGDCMWLQYVTDNQGNPKDGVLRTSLVTSIKDVGLELVVDTMNSRYIFSKV